MDFKPKKKLGFGLMRMPLLDPADEAAVDVDQVCKMVDLMETKKYKCGKCGFTYDPEVGDPRHGIAPGTPFEDLPDDWTCPGCKQPKEKFNRA